MATERFAQPIQQDTERVWTARELAAYDRFYSGRYPTTSPAPKPKCESKLFDDKNYKRPGTRNRNMPEFVMGLDGWWERR